MCVYTYVEATHLQVGALERSGRSGRKGWRGWRGMEGDG